MSDAKTMTVSVNTAFGREGKRFWVERLCGMAVGREGVDNGPAATQGVALLKVDGRRYEGGLSGRLTPRAASSAGATR